MSVYEKAYTERDGSVFAEYPNLTVEYRDASHRYWLHQDGERTPAVSVTSALKVLDKPALMFWAERCGAEGAARLAEMGELDGIIPSEAVNIVRLHKMGMDAKRDAGADRGTALHNTMEQWMRDGTVPNLADFHPDTRGFVQALCRWLIAAEPAPIQFEIIVGSTLHGYAGRLDLIAEVAGRRVLVDLKTSATGRTYPEAHAQCRGYAVALPECGFEPVDGALIVGLGEDGSFQACECMATDEQWLAILACHRAMTSLRTAVDRQRKVLEMAA